MFAKTEAEANISPMPSSSKLSRSLMLSDKMHLRHFPIDNVKKLAFQAETAPVSHKHHINDSLVTEQPGLVVNMTTTAWVTMS